MKQILNICLYVLVFIGFSSCTEWLELNPEDAVIRDRFWKTEGEANSALMGCYASMMEDDVLLRYFIWGEMRADMVTPTSTADEHIFAIRNGEIVSSNKYATWSYFYRTINQCNTLLELAPLAQENDLSFSEAELKQYSAEAVCIRSLAYFYLLRTFRDVPYITKASIYDDQDFSIPATPQAAIVDSLIVALTAVENDIAFSFDDEASRKGRFTIWGLKALLADIYLWKGDYENCIAQCTQIINSNQFSLIPIGREEVIVDGDLPGTYYTVYYANESDVANFFNRMFVRGNCTESILELQVGTDKNTPFASWFNAANPRLQAKIPDLRNEYFPSSSIDRGWSDIRTEGVSFMQGYIWKWIGLSQTDASNYRTTAESHSNWIFYRLSDIILMKAEALTQQAMGNNDQTKLLEAKELLLQIRNRANAPESTDLLFNQEGNIAAITMEEFILLERAREFLYEGKRWFDVLRHARRDNYSEKNLKYLIRLAILSTTPEKVTSLQNKWQNNFGSHYMPIYIDEIRTNKNLVQNEFYRDKDE